MTVRLEGERERGRVRERDERGRGRVNRERGKETERGRWGYFLMKGWIGMR